MENNTGIHESSNTEDNASAIFGTSSDAIIEGLHKGEFMEADLKAHAINPGDNEKIVNQQEQQRIVNPGAKEFNSDEPVGPDSSTSSLLSQDGEHVFREKQFQGDKDITEDDHAADTKPQ